MIKAFIPYNVATDWEKVFATQIINKELVFGIYKGHL